ncbi:efflux RND transporter periplasmic adaptor subunit [uncultured Thiodictyon sp.]|uniref:efflux RND transporter periplasmic adaptor subunit n=1 Tax=uncultured Thiodictyon sp. TaxID=1846217 RepID=UPI0025E8929D|nr:efflux RND transporter periplasmic adaptor subunit [uncultured Thiodictyon sp.]
MLRRLALPVSIMTAILLLAGCGRPAPSPAGGPPGAPPQVGIVTVAPRAATLTTELAGRTSPYRIAEVRPQVGGIIQERSFQEGAAITVNQVLYRIDPALYQAAYDSAKATLSRSRATLDRARIKAERYTNLVKSKSVSQEDYDDTEAALKQAIASVAVDEAAVETARINLEFTRVTSPIAGRIGRSMVTQGALVTANQAMALATVQQLDPIYVDLTQSNSQLLQLRRALEDGRLQRPDGKQAKVTLTLEDGSTFNQIGRLEFSEVTVDRGTGAVTLRASFANPDHVLLPGMFVRARVEEGVRPDAILVPQQAVSRNRLGQPTALVLTADDRVESRALTVDRAQGNLWLIDSGLNPGDRLIAEGTQKVKPGDKANAVAIDLSAQPGPAAPATAKKP